MCGKARRIARLARWQHSYVHYYLQWGDTVAPSELCHAFLDVLLHHERYDGEAH